MHFWKNIYIYYYQIARLRRFALLLSVVIPVYNEEKLIDKLLLKISNIKNLNKEIILINDGSTDGTKKIIEELVEHQK